ncbi:hypothetical protein [Nesterenkonia pannonica]|uniref:hypothetical protein n=1 Tax=Nesterenkonia pannonica TaxID=1548602 RepID=UPI0021645955|nr:hypothetical protein [Nesterenkonia pannonica]
MHIYDQVNGIAWGMSHLVKDRAYGVWLLVSALVGAAASFLLLHERVMLWGS